MKRDDILKPVEAGDLALHQLETVLDADEAAGLRRGYIEKHTGEALEALAPLPFGAEAVRGKNIENLIGSVSLPLGVAGPLTVKGTAANGSFYVPLATTEGALVASINRGCKLLSQAGGVRVTLEDHGMTRAPLFEAKDLAEAKHLRQWAETHEKDLAQTAEATSQHLKWLGMEAYQAGRFVWLRLRFDTQEAMGMNMATIAAQAVSDHICQQVNVRLLALSGNLCVDKKPSYQNIIAGRGYNVQAEVRLPSQLIEATLKTTPERLAHVATAKNWYGGGLSGSVGANAHAANVVAAVFLATGQDAAHIVDASTCFTICEAEDDVLYMSVSLPNVVLGSVGGGTGLVQQQAARRLMIKPLAGKASTMESQSLAEVLAGAVLAGELSLLGALAANTLAQAHAKLGRRGQ